MVSAIWVVCVVEADNELGIFWKFFEISDVIFHVNRVKIEIYSDLFLFGREMILRRILTLIRSDVVNFRFLKYQHLPSYFPISIRSHGRKRSQHEFHVLKPTDRFFTNFYTKSSFCEKFTKNVKFYLTISW